MTRSQWAKHATECPWHAPERRCHWGDSTAFAQTRIKCRERRCPLLDVMRHPFGRLYQQLAALRAASPPPGEE